MQPARRPRGFTIIEMLVVLALIALTLTLVAPRYIGQTQRAREAVLRNNLKETRAAIDRYYADTGGYPSDLQQLVDGRYLRVLPYDPMVGRSDAWLLEGPKAAQKANRSGGAAQGGASAVQGASESSAAAASADTAAAAPAAASAGIYDLHSSAPGSSSEGSSYAKW